MKYEVLRAALKNYFEKTDLTTIKAADFDVDIQEMLEANGFKFLLQTLDSELTEFILSAAIVFLRYKEPQLKAFSALASQTIRGASARLPSLQQEVENIESRVAVIELARDGRRFKNQVEALIAKLPNFPTKEEALSCLEEKIRLDAVFAELVLQADIYEQRYSIFPDFAKDKKLSFFDVVCPQGRATYEKLKPFFSPDEIEAKGENEEGYVLSLDGIETLVRAVSAVYPPSEETRVIESMMMSGHPNSFQAEDLQRRGSASSSSITAKVDAPTPKF